MEFSTNANFNNRPGYKVRQLKYFAARIFIGLNLVAHVADTDESIPHHSQFRRPSSLNLASDTVRRNFVMLKLGNVTLRVENSSATECYRVSGQPRAAPLLRVFCELDNKISMDGYKHF